VLRSFDDALLDLLDDAPTLAQLRALSRLNTPEWNASPGEIARTYVVRENAQALLRWYDQVRTLSEASQRPAGGPR
jgi:hypothetical protein